jgi:hypothetical protein
MMFKVQYKKLLLTLLAVGAVAFISSMSAHAQTLVRDVDAAATTHVGRKASELVSLSGLFDSAGQVFFLRTLPNGNAESFTIPKGMMLVITDIHWQITAGNPGTVARLSLITENNANPALIRLVYNSVLTLNSGGVNNSNDRFTTGILVSWEAKIKAKLTIPTGALDTLFLIGYLVPEE